MKVTITYLQMFARPERVVPPPRDGLAVVHARKPTVAYYRFLYDAVGRDYGWPRCNRLSDAELAALLNDPRLEVHVLTAEGVLAGAPRRAQALPRRPCRARPGQTVGSGSSAWRLTRPAGRGYSRGGGDCDPRGSNQGGAPVDTSPSRAVEPVG
jgi:hypothetical protein